MFELITAVDQELALQLLFANQKDIKLVDIPNVQHKERMNVTTLTNGLDVAATVDYVFDDQLIIWSDIGSETIRGMRMNDSRSFSVINNGIMSPDGVRCDWLSKKLYWLDSETNRIEVAQFDGRNRKVLYWQDFDQPRGIALVPHKGLMFWTDWGEVPKIERASMDGDLRSRVIIIDKNIEWPNGLTVDYETDLIYWVDAKLQRIESATQDGKDRQVILSENIPHPFAIAVYKDYLFWTDWINKSVNLCNKTNGKNRRELIPAQNQLHPMDIHVFSKDRQPHHPTPCDDHNGGCSHLCLLSHQPEYSSVTFSCACPTGIQLLPDQKNCASKAESLLIIARQSDIRQLSLDTADYTHSVLNVRGVKHAIAVDYDIREERVFWTDDDAHLIRSVFLNGTHPVDIISVDIDQPEGLAIDWVARNLYWTDTGSDRIEVSRLNGSFRKILISEGLSEPRAIAVSPERGYFYWTDWGQQPKIERAALDGSLREQIVNTSIKWPNSLTIDHEHDQIYWCDAYHDVIETASLTGSGRRVLVSEQLPHVFSVSALDEWVYWTDWSGRSVERVNKMTGASRELIVDQLPDMMALKATHTDRSKLRGTNACAFLNGNCSQLCLFTPQTIAMTATSFCQCSTGFVLLPDGRTCATDEHYVPEQRTRKPSEGRVREKPNSQRKACQVRHFIS
jgi:low density lipoprotein receptor-related protein 5/6